MLNHLIQDKFEMVDFDATGVNLHSRKEKTQALVFFVHGLGGKGYGTWGDIPRMVFEGEGGAPIDVVIFDYPSGPRLLWKLGAALNGPIDRLSSALKAVESIYGYEEIYIAAHSLGGIVTQEAVRNTLQGPGRLEVSSLAAVFFFASPRSGSGWARWPMREADWLKRFNSRLESLASYYNTHIETRHATTSLEARFFLPHYACIATEDIFVSGFSAKHGIPDSQQYSLIGSHSSIVRPKKGDEAVVRWVKSNINNVSSKRSYLRKQQDARRLPIPSKLVIADLRIGLKGTKWLEVYNDVRSELSGNDVVVHDKRDFHHYAADVIICVGDSSDVMSSDEKFRSSLLRACEDYNSNSERSLVGICITGEGSVEAVSIIEGWMPSNLAGGMFFIESAESDATVPILMKSWINAVIRMRPESLQERTRIDKILESSSDRYQIPGDYQV